MDFLGTIGYIPVHCACGGGGRLQTALQAGAVDRGMWTVASPHHMAPGPWLRAAHIPPRCGCRRWLHANN
ncbi:hypothetical protein HaLaN_31257, partial [Haematococcus lacustris]